MLQARPALADVQISYGSPLPNPRREVIWLADVDGRQETRSLGRYARNEELTLTVYIDVLRVGADQQAATERAFVIAAELEDGLRNEPALTTYYTGAGQIAWAVVGGPLRLQERASDQDREALIEMSIQWFSRI